MRTLGRSTVLGVAFLAGAAIAAHAGPEYRAGFTAVYDTVGSENDPVPAGFGSSAAMHPSTSGVTACQSGSTGRCNEPPSSYGR